MKPPPYCKSKGLYGIHYKHVHEYKKATKSTKPKFKGEGATLLSKLLNEYSESECDEFLRGASVPKRNHWFTNEYMFIC